MLLTRVPVPSELLTEIFRFCGPFSNGRYWDGLLIRQSPWVLSHVCRRWRVTVLSTPMLWCMFSIDLSLSRTWQASEGVLQLTSLFLERSGHCSISLAIYGDNSPQNRPILEALMSTSDRWEDLRIFSDSAFTQALSPIRGHISRLRRLEVHRDDRPIRIDAFADAPHLHHAVLSYDPWMSVILPWKQLTEFQTAYCEVGTILTTLRELVNLVTLTLDRLDPEDSDVTVQPFHLLRLRTLSITAEGAERHPGDLLDHLILPALVCLTVDSEGITICPHLTALIDRSECVLESLTLSIDDTFDISIAAVLGSTPGLTYLSLCGLRVSDELFARLMSTEPVLAPLLASLTLRAQFSQEFLLLLVTSRFAPRESEPGRALKELRISLDVMDLEAFFADRMLDFNDMGFHVELLR
ncbi:hypothetical protein DFH07DRAFT_759503 [Mycena maculata]|uniref:F-box domain-containing protein n=1 Tax=Mycena maculata TaxID=230809 RepID=A0AAD7HMT5_9AGAR|nr:hypothetical protein DFH07DRAFT_759503 [Mycena maculata]